MSTGTHPVEYVDGGADPTGGGNLVGMTSPDNQPPSGRTTTAFYAQAAISFGIALLTMVLAVLYVPVDPWVRAFLGLGVLYLTTSAFTLAKCVRDAHESQAVITRLDQARVDAILSQHDPFRPLT